MSSENPYVPPADEPDPSPLDEVESQVLKARQRSRQQRVAVQALIIGAILVVAFFLLFITVFSRSVPQNLDQIFTKVGAELGDAASGTEPKDSASGS